MSRIEELEQLAQRAMDGPNAGYPLIDGHTSRKLLALVKDLRVALESQMEASDVCLDRTLDALKAYNDFDKEGKTCRNS